MKYFLTYYITLEQDLVATQFESDPNSQKSLPYLAGSLLRGALIHHFLAAYPEVKDLPLDQNAKRLFFSQEVRFLNAYPVVKEGAACIICSPKPASWVQEKGSIIEPIPIKDSILAELGNTKQWESIGGGFVYTKGEELHFIDAHHVSRLHTQRDRQKGRSVEGSGALFQYEVLEKNQVFGGYILADQPEEDLLEWLQTPLFLGGDVGAGYGKCTIEIPNPTWQDITGEFKDAFLSSEKIQAPSVITLMSDAILRDEQGHINPSPAAFIHCLNKRTKHAYTLDSTKTFSKTTLVGGFNKKWGLPLPQTMAMKMGSVMVLNEKLTPEDLALLQTSGLGERKNEGFGVLSFKQSQESFDKKEDALSIYKIKPKEVSLTGYDAEVAQQILTALLKKRLMLQVKSRGKNFAQKLQMPAQTSTVTSTQIQQLRTKAQEALHQNTEAAVHGLLKFIEQQVYNKRNILKMFHKEHLGKLCALLKEVGSISSSVTTSYFKASNIPNFNDILHFKTIEISLANLESTLTKDLVLEITLSFVYEVFTQLSISLRNKKKTHDQ